MATTWIGEELETADLKDKRLDRRFELILEQLAGHPTASIPAACNGAGELQAAYRFFDNDKVIFETILQPHIDSTRKRIAAQPVVLIAADTTEIDLTRPQQQVVGAGLLDGNSRCGVLLHETQAFTPDGTPLGTVHALQWTRADQPEHAPRTRAELAALPIEEKESFRWLLSLRAAIAEAERSPGTQVVYLADSESDIYEVIAEAMEGPDNFDWIIRCCQNRALVDDDEQRSVSDYLYEELRASPVVYESTIAVRGREPKVGCEDRGRRQPRQSRIAEVEARTAQVTLRAPHCKEGQLADVTVNALLITEKNPPEGDVAVEWLLVTSLPIDTSEQVQRINSYYCQRFMIEVFYRTLKSGCRAEERRFETLDRQLPYLAICLIVAWRTLMVCRLGRGCPEISCEAIFTPGEWRSVYQMVKRTPPPKTPPKLQVMVRLVAQLGGYVNTKNRKDEPGPQTVWIGLQRLHDIAACWAAFGPGAAQLERDDGEPDSDL
jgi:hypothetical protein